MNSDLPEGVSLRVTAGDPTPEEIAILLVALAGQDAACEVPIPQTDVPAWARAARHEAVGGPPVVTPADLRRLH